MWPQPYSRLHYEDHCSVALFRKDIPQETEALGGDKTESMKCFRTVKFAFRFMLPYGTSVWVEPNFPTAICGFQALN